MRKLHIQRLLSLFLMLLKTSTLLAVTDSKDIPAYSRPVVDEVGILSSRSEELESELNQLHETGRLTLAVYVVKSLRGMSIEEFSVKVFEKWKLGTKGKDQGVLFVIAPYERKMRLEVGYGLEGDLTDAFCFQVLEGTVKKYFKRQEFYLGISAGVRRLAERLGLLKEGQISIADETNKMQSKAEPKSFFPISLHGVGILGVVYFACSQIAFQRRHRALKRKYESSGGDFFSKTFRIERDLRLGSRSRDVFVVVLAVALSCVLLFNDDSGLALWLAVPYVMMVLSSAVNCLFPNRAWNAGSGWKTASFTLGGSSGSSRSSRSGSSFSGGGRSGGGGASSSW